MPITDKTEDISNTRITTTTKLIGYRRGAVDGSYIAVYEEQIKVNGRYKTVYRQGDDFSKSRITTNKPEIHFTTDYYDMMHKPRECKFDTLEKIESFLISDKSIDPSQYLDYSTGKQTGVFNMALLRYYGAKWRLSKWITSYFPPSDFYDCYVDVFGGGGSMSVLTPSAPVKVYNDLDKWVWNFMTILREKPQELIDAIMYTPYSRFELDRCCAKIRIEELAPLEAARRYYVRSWQDRALWAAPTGKAGGWRHTKFATSPYPPNDFYDVNDIFIAAEKLRAIQIENKEASVLIADYDSPKTLFYLDPPYSVETVRTTQKGYAHEMPEHKHRDLIEQILKLEGFVIISGYSSSLYRDLLKDWEMKTKDDNYGGSSTKQECLWLSPNISAIQLRMF